MTESFISSMKGINSHTDDNNIVTFEVLTAVTMKITVSWDVTSCTLDVQYQGFRKKLLSVSSGSNKSENVLQFKLKH